jgi:hypothetical protein
MKVFTALAVQCKIRGYRQVDGCLLHSRFHTSNFVHAHAYANEHWQRREDPCSNKQDRDSNQP